ncbi:hypothetical protein JCM13580A_22190 [Streptomyces drozdowiczii]
MPSPAVARGQSSARPSERVGAAAPGEGESVVCGAAMENVPFVRTARYEWGDRGNAGAAATAPRDGDRDDRKGPRGRSGHRTAGRLAATQPVGGHTGAAEQQHRTGG